MRRYQVSTHSGKHVEVEGGNWLVALGLGLDALGMVANIDRLACEVLPGNTVIVQDVRAGERFVVRALSDNPDEPLSENPELEKPEETEEAGVFIMAGDPDLAEDGDSEDDFIEDTDERPELEISEDSDDVDDFLGDLMPMGTDTEDLEMSLFSISHEGGRGSHVHFSTPTDHNIVTLPAQEELALPEEDTDDLDPQVEALLMRLDESATTFDAWKMALEGARRVCRAESGAALCQEEDGALRFLFAVGPRAHEVLGRRLPPGRGIAGFCIQRDVSLLITEPRLDPRFFSRMDQTTGYITTSVLAVPVATDDEMLGCLELLNAPGGFRQEQLEQLSTLAFGLAERLTQVRG
ncbi:MAG: hypothetical protein ACI8RZ_001348 [Myxococcota bacterium]|jgi:hypothetical protein